MIFIRISKVSGVLEGLGGDKDAGKDKIVASSPDLQCLAACDDSSLTHQMLLGEVAWRKRRRHKGSSRNSSGPLSPLPMLLCSLIPSMSQEERPPADFPCCLSRIQIHACSRSCVTRNQSSLQEAHLKVSLRGKRQKGLRRGLLSTSRESHRAD